MDYVMLIDDLGRFVICIDSEKSKCNIANIADFYVPHSCVQRICSSKETIGGLSTLPIISVIVDHCTLRSS